MSLKALPIPSISEETVRVAHVAFHRGNRVMQVRDVLEAIYTDEAFANLFPTHGQPCFRSLAADTGNGLSIHGRFDRSPGR